MLPGAGLSLGGILTIWGGFPKLGVPTIMENQMEKKMENEMEKKMEIEMETRIILPLSILGQSRRPGLLKGPNRWISGFRESGMGLGFRDKEGPVMPPI